MLFVCDTYQTCPLLCAAQADALGAVAKRVPQPRTLPHAPGLLNVLPDLPRCSRRLWKPALSAQHGRMSPGFAQNGLFTYRRSVRRCAQVSDPGNSVPQVIQHQLLDGTDVGSVMLKATRSRACSWTPALFPSFSDRGSLVCFGVRIVAYDVALCFYFPPLRSFVFCARGLSAPLPSRVAPILSSHPRSMETTCFRFPFSMDGQQLRSMSLSQQQKFGGCR